MDKPRWKDISFTSSLERAIALGDTTGFSDARSTGHDGVTTTFIKASLSRLFVFTNPAAWSRYLSEEAAFIATEGRRDVHYDFDRRIHLLGTTARDFRHKILIVRTGLSDVAWASQVWFWVASFLWLTVPYRIWFSKHCRPAELTLTKTIDS